MKPSAKLTIANIKFINDTLNNEKKKLLEEINIVEK